jgi:hypothetical protein
MLYVYRTEKEKKWDEECQNQQIFEAYLLTNVKIPKPFTSQTLKHLKYLGSQFSPRDMLLGVVL